MPLKPHEWSATPHVQWCIDELLRQRRRVRRCRPSTRRPASRPRGDRCPSRQRLRVHGDQRRPRPRRAICPAPGRRAVHRAQRRHGGRVPGAAARAGRARQRVDRRQRGRRRQLADRAEGTGRDRRVGRPRCALAAPRQARPRDVHRARQGRRPPADRAGDRRGHGDLRRRAVRGPAAQPRGQGEGEGRRPDGADPRHLRPARPIREGKAQVELAQLGYLIQRLRGWGGSLSRQAGGIGGRGRG